MTNQPDNDILELALRLVDAAYLAWFQAENECERALHAWSDNAWSTRTSAYFSYRAALDREAAAAGDLQRLCTLTRPFRTRTSARAAVAADDSPTAPAHATPSPSGHGSLTTTSQWLLP